MQAPIVLPDLGLDSASPVHVSLWFAEEGDEVLEGDRLLEVLAGAAVIDVPAPASGRLIEIRRVEEDAVQAGDVLGVLETNEGLDE